MKKHWFVTINDKRVRVYLPRGLPESAFDDMVNSKMFQKWCARLDPRFRIGRIIIQSVDMFGSRVGFIKIVADIQDENGNFIPYYITLRGDSVAILVVLKCEGEEYAILTKEPRSASGDFEFRAIPAGMLDDSGSFLDIAAKELREETGIETGENELLELTQGLEARSFYLSPGGCDETMRIYCCQKTATREELENFQGKRTGIIEEGEKISLTVVPLHELWTVPDGKTLVAIGLYEKAKAAGKLS